MTGLENVRIVLVEPITGGNIGAVCRAMMNCGMTDLAIVAPRSNTDWDSAVNRARTCTVLDERTEYQTLAEAVSDCTLVVGTSARTGFYRNHAQTPREMAPKLLESARAGYKTALVFGREDMGLRNEELALCDVFVNIPSHEMYASLNLSHAVMICCYEVFCASGVYEHPQETWDEATSDLKERMYALWSEMMLATGFSGEEKLEHMMMGLRRIFSRGKLTEADVRILMGLARQAIWVSQGSCRDKQ